jgi:hypothetical protein
MIASLASVLTLAIKADAYRKSPRSDVTARGGIMTRANPLYPPDVSLEGQFPATRRSFLAMMAALIGPAASAQDDVENRDKSTQRLEAMLRLAKEVKVCEITGGKPGPPLVLRPKPLLRFSNPADVALDGTLWVWGERGRPPALMKLGLRERPPGQMHWHFGVTALSPKRVEVEFGDGSRWSSRLSGLPLQAVPDAAPPADSAAQRLTQAKSIARRVSIGVERQTAARRIQLRLLPRPIDLYSDPTAGLLDGVLFGFVDATVPVVLLLLEAWSEGPGASRWRCAFLRQAAAEMTALLDGKLVWSVPRVPQPADTELFKARGMPASPEEQH